MTGRILSHYRVLEKLGEGGMGAVYKARDLQLGRFAALKVLPPDRMGSPDSKARFIHEARAASALNHPNIVTIFEIGEQDGIDFIAMEYVQGKTLAALIGNSGLPVNDVLHYGAQIADALGVAHASSIVHRDLKPANVMVTDQGAVKVLDFGLAKLAEPETVGPTDRTVTIGGGPLTERGAILGTVSYMSPEQAEGKPVDRRSDIFAFGSVLYEMVSGRRAFVGETKVATLSAILHSEPTPLAEFGCQAPAELDRIIHRCLRKERGRRFQDIAEVRLSLLDLKEESESGRLRPAPPAAVPPSKPKFPRWWIAAAIGLVAIPAAWQALRPKPPASPATDVVRLTSDGGLTTDPAVSPDDKLLAYASDRAGKGNLDIWIRQLAGGEPVQLTREEADDREPAFSPDGTQIAFRSERAGGGVYVMSALGGEPRLLIPGGRAPRYSPDGKWIAYWSGKEGGDLGTHRSFYMPAGGGAAIPIAPAFFSVLLPAWSPDSRHLIFRGAPVGGDNYAGEPWWVAGIDGAKPVETGSAAGLREQRIASGVSGFEWLPGRLIFASGRGWSARINSSFKLDEFERLIPGSTADDKPRPLANGSIVYNSGTSNGDPWLHEGDMDAGKLTGIPIRLTDDLRGQYAAVLSHDAKSVVYGSAGEIRNRDLTTGRDSPLATRPFSRLVLSRNDQRLFVVAGSAKSGRSVVAVPRAGGSEEPICDDCHIWDISPDNGQALFTYGYTGSKRSIGVIDLATRQRQPIVSHPKHSLYASVWSPDAKWVAFAANIGPRTQVILVPSRPGADIPETEWIPVTAKDDVATIPAFSPNGKLLYFFSEQDGFRCIWARRLNASTMRPTGDPIGVYHSHHARLSIGRVPFGSLSLSIAASRMVFPMVEESGNIWMRR